MIIRLLASSTSFNAVNYNTGKVDQGMGELMKTANFGGLEGLGTWRPEDYKNYFRMLWALNSRIKGPQFHAALSAEGRSADKYELTGLAEKWLMEMGYGAQPYMIIFHKDTANNHVHMVSCRVGRDGKKIKSDFDKLRAVEKLNKLLKLDTKQQTEQSIMSALAYRFSTKAQFLMILESKGFTIKEIDGNLQVIRYGKVQAELPLSEVNKRLAKEGPTPKKRAQLKSIILKYAAMYNTVDLAVYLKARHGIELVFHSKKGKQPYGYSVLDQAAKAVYKGSEILTLNELLSTKVSTPPEVKEQESNTPDADKKAYYRDILKAVIRNDLDFRHGLHHEGLQFAWNDGQFFLIDTGNSSRILFDELLDDKELDELQQHMSGINLIDDADDEQVHGRKRKGKNSSQHHNR